MFYICSESLPQSCPVSYEHKSFLFTCVRLKSANGKSSLTNYRTKRALIFLVLVALYL